MLFKVNESSYHIISNEYVKKNPFLTMQAEDIPLPIYEDSKEKLPIPFWENHDSVINCYNKAWEIAFKNLRKPIKENGFVSNFIDTAFNGCLFMWDSSFITMFGKYATNVLNSQKTLDNIYSHQHRDGFICREIFETQNGEFWHRDDPCSTGPNVLAWSEWEYYKTTGDKERLSQVFYPLIAYHRWLYLNRTWQDGTYWSCGFACGMDNQARMEKGYCPLGSHGHMVWVDICAQMLISGKTILKMAKELDSDEDLSWIKEEVEYLSKIINEKLWDEEDGFYYDLWRGDRRSKIMTIGAYWNLLADIVPKDRLDRFVAHLDNEKEFKRYHRVSSFPATSPDFREDGGYWLGSVWAPTNYMILKGLRKNGYEKMAFEIAENHVENVVKVFEETGTLWENYSSEFDKPGNPARPDFVGWTGLSPISILFEYVFGIEPISSERKIIWNINLDEKFGVKQYPFLDGSVDLEFEGIENGKPVVKVKSDLDFDLVIKYNGEEIKYIG